MGESLDSKIKELCDGDKEAQLRKKIRKRIIRMGQDKQNSERNTRDLGKVWETCIEPIDRLRKSRNTPGLDGWCCGLGQFVDWNDPEIYEVLPYLLTSYMYNFYLRTRRKELHLDGRWSTRNILVEKLLEAYKPTRKRMNGKALFKLENADLSKQGIGTLLFETEGTGELYVENTQLWRQIDYLARDFIFPEMTTCETIPLGPIGLDEDITWIPKKFRQDAKAIAEELGKPKKEIEKELNYRNTAENVTIVSEFQDIYIGWFYVLHKHREMFGESFQLDSLTSSILLYKNISGPERLRERLRWLGAEDKDTVENAREKIETALLKQYDQRMGQNQ